MKRLLAFVVAIGLVAGAAAIRSSRDGGGSSASSSHPVRLVCADDLGAACDAASHALGVAATREPAGTTAARLEAATGTDPALDAWVVTSPWPDIVDAARDAKGQPKLFTGARSVVARPKLALVLRADRGAALNGRPECKPVNWVCLGKVAAVAGGWAALGGRPEWGLVKLGIPSADTAVGLAVLGQAVGEYFGPKALSSTDLDDDAFVSWLTALGRAVPTSTSVPPVDAIVTASGSYDAVGAAEPDVTPIAGITGVAVLYPAPVVTVDVVLAGVVGGTKVGPVKATTGPPQGALPPAGFLDALRDKWKQVGGR